MPLEIRELVIRVNVNESGGANRLDEEVIDQKLKDLKARIVLECTEKILAKIEKIRER